MLKEAKRACGIEEAETAYDDEIASICEAGAFFLKDCGIILRGQVSFSRDAEGNVVDNSTLTEAYPIEAICIYCRQNFRQPANYEQLRDAFAYHVQKMKMSSFYTNWGEE